MRPHARLPLVCLLLSATAACSSGSGGDTDQIARCEVDLTPWQQSGSGASAKLATEADLFDGEAALGRAGDVLLSNERIRVLVETPSTRVGSKPQGGNIIDADIVRPGGRSHDQFGELPTFLNFGRTVEFERIEILKDGQSGGPAVVAATGRDVPYDFVHLQGLLRQYLSGVSLPDANQSLDLRVTSYYVLNPGSQAVKVVQALCYEGSDGIAIPVGDLVNSGGEVEVFGGYRGFGSTGTGGVRSIIDSLGASDGHPFYGYVGEEVAYGYVPEADRIQVLTVAGVSGTLFNGRDIASWIDAERGPPPEGAVMLLKKGDQATVVRDFVVSRDAAGIYDYFYEKTAKDTGVVQGTITSADGKPLAGVRVSAMLPDRIASLFTTDAQGKFSGRVPVGTLDLMADDGVVRSASIEVQVAKGNTVTQDVTLPDRAKVQVKIRNAAGEPMPGKVTIVCASDCLYSRSDNDALRFRDTGVDGMPRTSTGETFDIRYVGPEAQIDLELPAGAYDVWVSRGIEYSLHKEAITLADGDQANVEARLGHVVDTTGWMSGDLHVHAIASPDSPIGNIERLKSFMAEGTDVIVATDHEIITDFTPFLASIPDGDRFLASITGVELTTFDYGHYNAFPLVRDDTKRNGGAPDWGNGNDAGMTPGELMASLHAFPGDQVVQLNHARNGFFSALNLDTRTLWSRAQPEWYRIRAVEPDPDTGDTRLFDDRFTALEIMNGHSVTDTNMLIHDWFALLNRGLLRTGTAVSDTHKRHGYSGTPRTYVRTGEDDPKKLDRAVFARELNAMRAVGTNGPFLDAKLEAAGKSAGPGETLKAGDGRVTLKLEVRTPDWMNVAEALVYVNTRDTETDGTQSPPNTLPAPHTRAALSFGTVAVGDHQAKRATASFDLELDEDAWVVVFVQGGSDLFPVVGKGGVTPRAFTNPILVDVGAEGWTAPVDLAAERARIGQLSGTGSPLRPAPTEEEIRHILEGACGHEH